MTHRLIVTSAAVSLLRLPSDDEWPAWARAAPFASVTRTSDELSILCSSAALPRSLHGSAKGPFRALRVAGTLDLSEVGVLASLTAPLAEAAVSVLSVSTHDTDWLLVPAGDLSRARAALEGASFAVEEETGRVVAIHRAKASRLAMDALDEGELVEDHGLQGDRHARAGSRAQLTLVPLEGLDAASAQLARDIPRGATRRNLTLSGVDLPPQGGRRLRLGPALVEITGPAEPCRLMDEVIAPGACKALEGRAGVRARVLEGGRVRPGDPVSVEGEP